MMTFKTLILLIIGMISPTLMAESLLGDTIYGSSSKSNTAKSNIGKSARNTFNKIKSRFSSTKETTNKVKSTFGPTKEAISEVSVPSKAKGCHPVTTGEVPLKIHTNIEGQKYAVVGIEGPSYLKVRYLNDKGCVIDNKISRIRKRDHSQAILALQVNRINEDLEQADEFGASPVHCPSTPDFNGPENDTYDFKFGTLPLANGDKHKGPSNGKSYWATNYYTLELESGTGNKSLFDKKNRPISHEDGEVALLSTKRWCGSAIEGSVRIKYKNGETIAYNYAGQGPIRYQGSCKKRAWEKTKFRRAISYWGEGVYAKKDKKSYSLVPYRSIAVDPRKIPYGSVVFIESAKGKEITLPNGKSFIHDGYFFAADTGGAIKGNHIDVFTGEKESKGNLDFIKSNASKTFNLQVVSESQNQELVKTLRDQHFRRYK